jgi:excisionase family DNA binding protein
MLPDPIEKPVLTLEEAADVLGIGRSTVYEAARSGQIPTRRINRRWIVPTEALRNWLADAESAKPAPDPEPITVRRPAKSAPGREPVAVRRD